jgi:hypothetical protein
LEDDCVRTSSRKSARWRGATTLEDLSVLAKLRDDD